MPELDYLDFHIYPVQYGFASDRVLKAAETARAKGKRVSIGEAWLYKVSSREFTPHCAGRGLRPGRLFLLAAAG